ncbi:MAG: SDR family NAD(P)-dependent oxidoreductase [Chthoniobacterales bacterium]
MSHDHTGKTALVTGGTDGIGKEVARGLARAGHSMALVGRNREKGIQAAHELRETEKQNPMRIGFPKTNQN